MEHGMKNMMMSKKETKKMVEGDMPEDRPQYPYGLKLNLDNETLEKLGMKTMPEMGKAMMMMAKVTVTDMHESKSEGSNYRSLGLQITDMAFEAEKESLEKRLYPEK